MPNRKNAILLTREELYEKVWSEPMITLAQKYGLSDVGLRKKCKKLNIPLPPQGYWLRSRQAKAENHPPLPSFHGDGTVKIKKNNENYPPASVDQGQYSEAEARIAFENLPENRIQVQARLTSPHPLVQKTKTILENIASTGKNTDAITAWNDECLDIRVSKQNLGRALRLMDALLKALESRNFKVSISGRSYGYREYITTVAALGIVHEFGLKENLQQIKNESLKKRKHNSIHYYPTVGYKPSGRFTLAIKSFVGDGGRTTWSDGKKQRIEDCLNDFIVGLIKASVVKRARNLEWERKENERIELARKRVEEEIRAQEEQARVHSLLTKTQNWKIGQQIRDYIGAVREAVIKKQGHIVPGSDIDQWLIWALQQADRFDPLNNQTLRLDVDKE
jgi:hypothetical protein